ncbi:MAG: hypothetical protein B7Y45_06355 [Sphingomonas sp. 28-66-16]|nr:MAG: hypothetical protein B7Y45_06355 [Sphingomonas sp. 28-66-16]
MKTIVRVAWLALAIIHLLPALGLISTSMRHRLYGVEPVGSFAILLSHRAFVFAAIVLASLFAVVNVQVRPAAAIAVSVSVVGFLIVYVAGGAPVGALRQVALVDCIAVPLLILVWIDVVRR